MYVAKMYSQERGKLRMKVLVAIFLVLASIMIAWILILLFSAGNYDQNYHLVPNPSSVSRINQEMQNGKGNSG